MKLNIAIEISEAQARKMISACGYEIKQVQYTDWVKVYHNRLEPKEVKSEMVEIAGRHCTIEDAVHLLYRNRITEHINNEIEKGL